MLCLANNNQTLMMPPGLAVVQPGPAPQLSLDQLGALALNNPAGKKRPREDEEVFHLVYLFPSLQDSTPPPDLT